MLAARRLASAAAIATAAFVPLSTQVAIRPVSPFLCFFFATLFPFHVALHQFGFINFANINFFKNIT